MEGRWYRDGTGAPRFQLSPLVLHWPLLLLTWPASPNSSCSAHQVWGKMRASLRCLPSMIHDPQQQMNFKLWIPAIVTRGGPGWQTSQPLMQTFSDSLRPEPWGTCSSPCSSHLTGSLLPRKMPGKRAPFPHLFSFLLWTWKVDAAPSLSLPAFWNSFPLQLTSGISYIFSLFSAGELNKA